MSKNKKTGNTKVSKSKKVKHLAKSAKNMMNALAFNNSRRIAPSS